MTSRLQYIIAGLHWVSNPGPGPPPANAVNQREENIYLPKFQELLSVLSNTRLHLFINCLDFIMKHPFPSSCPRGALLSSASINLNGLCQAERNQATSLPSLPVPTCQKSDRRREKIKGTSLPSLWEGWDKGDLIQKPAPGKAARGTVLQMQCSQLGLLILFPNRKFQAMGRVVE